MKTKLSALAICVCIFSMTTLSQSVLVTSNKITYKRPKPQVDFKKTFTITYPVVKAATPALSKKIEKAINPVTVLEIDMKGEMGEFQWLESSEFEVKYNDNGVLCVDAFMEGSAAYPSNLLRTVVVDTKTGLVVKSASVFTNTGRLTALINERQKKEIAAAIVEIKKNKDFEDPNPERLFGDAEFTTEDLDGFVVTKEGVTFKYAYAFPHVIKALQPNGEFLFSWAEVKPFIKPGGLLSRIGR